MNKFDTVNIILTICALLSGIGFAISGFFMEIYLYKKKLLATWKLITGLYFPWELLGKYRQSTREEYGHTGIWFKLFIIFIAIFMIGGFTDVAIAIAREASWVIIAIVGFSALLLLPLIGFVFYSILKEYY